MGYKSKMQNLTGCRCLVPLCHSKTQHADVIAPLRDIGTVAIYDNPVVGTWTRRIFPAGCADARSVAIADFDHNGHKDWALACIHDKQIGVALAVSVFLLGCDDEKDSN